MKSMIPKKCKSEMGLLLIEKLHVVTTTKELHDEAFNKLQKKVIEELVAKLKLLERKISLLCKENSLQSCVIMQLKKHHSTKSKIVQHCDRGHLFCKKIPSSFYK